MKASKAGRAVAGPKPHSVIDPLPSDPEGRRIGHVRLVERLPNRSGLGVDLTAVRGPS